MIKRIKTKINHNTLSINGLNNWNDKEVEITIRPWKNRRTLLQNRALHLWFTMLSNELNAAGFDMRKLISKEIDIPWSEIAVKEYLWRPVQKEYLRKKSTTKLTTTDINKVYDIINKIIAERTGIHIPFPKRY